MTLRLVFFGTPEFAATALRRLLRSRHQVVGVVTQPDRPRGRGQKLAPGAVKSVAEEALLPVLQPERLKVAAFQDALSAVDADLGVVAAYGRILPEAVIATPRLGLINIHASILPRYRGAAPVHRAVIAGEAETGVSIMRVVRELDAGPVFAVGTRAIGPEETSEEVERALAEIGAELCVNVVDDLAQGTAREVPQDDRLATYAPRLTKAEGVLDWRRSAIELHNRVRGLHPWPLAQAALGGERLLVLRTGLASHETPGAPGEVVHAAGDEFLVATGNGTLRILELQPEARRAMRAREFLAGRRVKPGMRFDVPAESPT
ncbi:MAG TPA: methionyl-tRNA formyltransferase [Vicinamibacterales bacterium]|nr:methionyl-tRNA formyltransferase [Vicinamibacterales bacterium]